MLSADDAVALTQRLIEISSINPDLVPGGTGEAEIASFCASWLEPYGFEPTRVEARPGRPSVLATRRGTGGGRSILLNGHIDTVGVADYDADPYAPEIRGGRLYGRGAFDMKAGVAAIMVAAVRAAGADPRGDIHLALVSDEEFGSIGTEETLAALAAETIDGAIVCEPSQLDLTVAHRGFAWFDIEVLGRASHGSMPEQGVDAIAHAGLVMRALDELQAAYDAEARHPLLGGSTVRVSMIQGGLDAATVAPSCTMTLEFRLLPGLTPDDVEESLRTILARLEATVPEFAARLVRSVGRTAFEADPEWPIVEIVARSAREVLGREATPHGEPYWTDAGLINDAGIPVLLIGVAGGGAHAAEEWAEVDSIVALTDILERSIREFCV